MKDINVVFMGTPDFAVPILEKLTNMVNVSLVVTKEDALVGRKKVLTPSPVKMLAQAKNIPVFTPKSLKNEYTDILAYQPDLIITCAYGKILNKELLDYPKLGCINIHASLLPSYRGASPMQWAIMNGDSKTGVTLMYMDEGMDTGDIIATLECNIEIDDNLENVHDKLSLLGVKILEENLENIVNGNVKRIKQDDNNATYANKITREMEELDFNQNVVDVYNKIRAFSPTPLTKTNLFDEEVKIVSAHFDKTKCEINKKYISKNSLGIGCIDGIIYFDKVKPSGKNIMNIKSYLNGKKIK